MAATKGSSAVWAFPSGKSTPEAEVLFRGNNEFRDQRLSPAHVKNRDGIRLRIPMDPTSLFEVVNIHYILIKCKDN